MTSLTAFGRQTLLQAAASRHQGPPQSQQRVFHSRAQVPSSCVRQHGPVPLRSIGSRQVLFHQHAIRQTACHAWFNQQSPDQKLQEFAEPREQTIESLGLRREVRESVSSAVEDLGGKVSCEGNVLCQLQAESFCSFASQPTGTACLASSSRPLALDTTPAIKADATLGIMMLFCCSGHEPVSFGTQVTVGDVSARAGVTPAQAEEALQALAADAQGTLQARPVSHVLAVQHFYTLHMLTACTRWTCAGSRLHAQCSSYNILLQSNMRL